MKLIVCVDDNYGMMFNNRRQSRDRVVIEDIINTLDGSKLYIDRYSEKLFERAKIDIVISDDLVNDIDADGACFLENMSAKELAAMADEIIIYHWNRRYPYDLVFDADIDKMGFSLKTSSEFEGYSHEKITKEIFNK